LKELARLIGETSEEEIDCAELLQRIAPYLKAVTDRDELCERLRQVAQHLKICPECHEEFLALAKADGIELPDCP